MRSHILCLSKTIIFKFHVKLCVLYYLKSHPCAFLILCKKNHIIVACTNQKYLYVSYKLLKKYVLRASCYFLNVSKV